MYNINICKKTEKESYRYVKGRLWVGDEIVGKFVIRKERPPMCSGKKRKGFQSVGLP